MFYCVLNHFKDNVIEQCGNVTEVDQLFNVVEKAHDIYRNLVHVKAVFQLSGKEYSIE